MAFDAAGASRDEVVALLFGSSMSGDPVKFAHDNGIDGATLQRLKLRHLEDYVQFLEAVLYRIKDQIDY